VDCCYEENPGTVIGISNDYALNLWHV